MNSTNVRSQLNQLITVSITVSILLFTLIFVIWTYRIEKNENAIFIENRISQVKKITEGLVEVQKIKLDSLSNVIINGPIFKGSISTGHEKTIVDVIDNFKNKNNLSFIIILNGKRIIYSDSETSEKKTDLKSITAGNIISIKKIDSKTIIFGKTLNHDDINQWSDITDSKFILSSTKTKEVLSRNDDNYDLKGFNHSADQTIDNKFIIGKQKLLKDTLGIIHLIPTQSIKKTFDRKKNKLLVFGLMVSFVGFIMSLLLSKLIINVFNKTSNLNNTDNFDYLIDEIEKLKGILSESK